MTTAPAEQGSPLIGFLPILGVSIVVGCAGETRTGGALVTVFPLRIGLVVFPLPVGLVVFVRERNRNCCRYNQDFGRLVQAMSCHLPSPGRADADEILLILSWSATRDVIAYCVSPDRSRPIL
jgi:hypothetical protein